MSAAPRQQKPVMYIVINDTAQSGKVIINHISKYTKELTQKYKIEIVKLCEKNTRLIKELGVRAAPTLVINGVHVAGAKKIIETLTPDRERQANFGDGFNSNEEAVHDYVVSAMGRPEDDDDDVEDRDEVIRKKMADFQKKRPQMSDNVPKDARISGGRQVTGRPPPKFNDDDESFIRASGRDNITETPTSNFALDEGDYALEDFYLDEAYAFGKKSKTVKINGNAM